MKAAVCYEFGRPLVIEDVDIDSPKQGEVKVRTSAVAICHGGSQTGMIRRNNHLLLIARLPERNLHKGIHHHKH